MIVSLMAAMSQNHVIGRDGKLPWHIPLDLKRFKEMTTGHPVIMGRKTFESIGKPLPFRENIIITRQPDYKAKGAKVVRSVDAALDIFKDTEQEVFILGGGEIYTQTVARADRIYLTLIHEDFEGDAYFPEFDYSQFKIMKREDHAGPPPFSFIDYYKK